MGTLPPTLPTVELAGDLLGEPLTAGAHLGGSQRSLVLRCTRTDGTSVVVKAYPADGRTSFLRERTGLREIPGTPRLLGADHAERVLVMEDLGSAPTLADLLLGEDRDAAWAGARTWAHALGALLGGTRGAARRVAAELDGAGLHDADTPAALSTGLARLTALGDGTTGLPPAPREAALARDTQTLLAALDRDVALAHGLAAVTPGDTCPDNAMRTPHGWRFLDAEGATVQHVALDAAYTLLPFATCWCVFDPPPGLADDLLAGFERGLDEPGLTSSDAWRPMLDAACGAWVLAMTGWLVDGALEDRPRIGPAGLPSPTYRQLVATRWAWTAERVASTLPAVADACARGAAWARRTWGEDALRLAPYPALG
ncbi:hypothetical protein GXB85_08810 [Cellulomonas sp. APG4]|uniref:hypothetical protein n=1 Tax=Cellulomonas sp. APG4 TaxID=1538656 RepID=UPI0013797AB2|nr:hypothetical protein [Cellulomonas sp. APG4]NCT91046.1 hypothetical protein [Cellulomonas sp. APG4]